MDEQPLPVLISVVTNKAADLVHGEFPVDRHVQKDCQKLCGYLLELQAVVEDAEGRSRADDDVRNWVRSLKHATLETEDMLDKLKYLTIGNVHPEKMAPHDRYPYFVLRIDPSLKHAIKKIELILTEMSKFGFKRSQQAVPHHVVDWPLTYKVDSTVIGRDDDLHKILGIVLGQEMKKEVAVLPIVGTRGIGKTTLAQLIYNDGNIQKHFDHRLWVCVNNKFDVARLTKSIADLVLPDSNLILDNTELLFQRLQAELGGTRYLLVLDDIRYVDSCEWRQLKHLLDCGSPGSVVIVTCHSLVYSIVDTMDPYYLPRLNNENLWEIFGQRAFGMGVKKQQKVVDIDMKLMKMCCGSPLLAKTLGGFMSYKKEEKEWLDVLEGGFEKEQLEWFHRGLMSYNEEIILSGYSLGQNYKFWRVLKLCYDNLPSHMKWCLAFCAVYPMDYEMERDTLIQLWMANSYIPSEKRDIEIEEKGVEIFNELVWRGFFHDVKEKDNGVVCKMHTSIHILVQQLVGKEFAGSFNMDQTLHISNFADNISVFEKNFFGFIRTMLVLPDLFHRDSIIFRKLLFCDSLRALSLTETLCRDIDYFPRYSRYLSYLDLSYSTNLEVLPESFSTLYLLQTLKLSHCVQLQHLPKNMRCMSSLRHVYLDGCYQLKQMPAGLGELRCLQTLTMYLVNPSIKGCDIGELQKLKLGGRLELYDLSKLANIEDAREGNLVSKRKLIQLYLSWGSVQSDLTESDDSNVVKSNSDISKEILQGLEPNEELQVLEVRQYNGTLFSAWMHDSRVLRNLTELILVKCTQCKTLPPIWEISSLTKLILIQLDSLEHVCSKGYLAAQGGVAALQKFAKLEHLSLVDMPNLESWLENDPAEKNVISQFLIQLGKESLDEVYETLEKLRLEDIASLESWPKIDVERLSSLAFPELHELIILRCPKLNTLPSCPSLKVLEIAGETIIPSSLIESFENKGVLVK